jgi:hypothetical protein
MSRGEVCEAPLRVHGAGADSNKRGLQCSCVDALRGHRIHSQWLSLTLLQQQQHVGVDVPLAVGEHLHVDIPGCKRGLSLHRLHAAKVLARLQRHTNRQPLLVAVQSTTVFFLSSRSRASSRLSMYGNGADSSCRCCCSGRPRKTDVSGTRFLF